MRSLATALVVVFAACSPSTSSPSASHLAAKYGSNPVTVTVINATGGSLQIGAAPNFSPPIPQPVAGTVILGTAATGSTCLAIPDSVVLTGESFDGSQHVLSTWTGSLSMQLTFFDPAASNGVGHTSDFIPDSANGWTLDVPTPGLSAAVTPCHL